jgi:methionine--tRNA ligase beta chain
MSDVINIEDFAKIEITVGKVSNAKNVEGSDKLIRLLVDIGEEEERIIFTGVRPFGYNPEDFEGNQYLFVTNLEPKPMMGEESQGMILAVDGQDKPFFISAKDLPIGKKVR